MDAQGTTGSSPAHPLALALSLSLIIPSDNFQLHFVSPLTERDSLGSLTLHALPTPSLIHHSQTLFAPEGSRRLTHSLTSLTKTHGSQRLTSRRLVKNQVDNVDVRFICLNGGTHSHEEAQQHSLTPISHSLAHSGTTRDPLSRRPGTAIHSLNAQRTLTQSLARSLADESLEDSRARKD